jgi:glutathione S-transferase
MTLRISSKNYSSWSLRGWLLCKLAGIEFGEERLSLDDPASRAELLLLSPSFLVPCLRDDDFEIWDTLAIAEYLAELCPQAQLYPADRQARARCRSISGEMHAGFTNLRSALPMNLKASYPGFRVWTNARADIERVAAIWRDTLAVSGGPFLFGATPSVADAMYAPVATRLRTYDVGLDPVCDGYCTTIMDWPPMAEWIEAARAEPDGLDELDVEF